MEMCKTLASASANTKKKGYVYTLEVMIAIGIILVAVVFLFNSAQVPDASNVAIIKRQGFEVIEFLDQKDELRDLVRTGDDTALKSKVQQYITVGISMELDICTNQCVGNVPVDKNVVSVDYYVSGSKDAFFNKKVRLWLWGNA